MTARQPQTTAAGITEYDDGFDDPLPPRPRTRYLTPLTALLLALILGGVGFFVGIRIEKAHAATSSSGTAGFAAPTASGKTAANTKTSTGAKTGAPSGALPGTAAGGTAGTVESVKGNTVYIKESNGNTVRVKLNKETAITKSESTSRKKVYPGDAVTISGSQGSNGTLKATSVTDSGASSTGTSTTSSSTSSSSSAVSSLFGG